MIDQFYTYFRKQFEQSPPCGKNSIVIHNRTISLHTSIGNNRSTNEDRSAFVIINNHLTNNKNIAVSILTDGMGGMDSGATAASVAIASFISYLAFNEHYSGLKEICRRATFHSNEVVNSLLRGKGGSTLSAIVYGENGCVGVNVGDSRIYYYDNSTLEQISIDDTISGQLENGNAETWEDPSLGDNRLAQFIGTPDELIPHTIDLTKYSQKLSSGFFLLTSDGTHYIGKKMINRIIKSSRNNDHIAKRLVKVSEWLSGHDNSTVVVCPNKITLNRIKTDIQTENTEQVSLFTIGKESTYLIPREFVRHGHKKSIFRDNNLKSQKYNSKNLFPANKDEKKENKQSAPIKKNGKESNKVDQEGTIVDLLPPVK